MLTLESRLRPNEQEVAAKVMDGEAIITRYDVPREQVQADVERLAAELLQENLLMMANDGGPGQKISVQEGQQKVPYEAPVLNIYRDMGDLLALDPPTPGLYDMAWKAPEDESSR